MKIMKVLLFPTCLVEKAGSSILEASMKILSRAGIQAEVSHPSSCCGQIAFNMGDWENARKMASRWIEIHLLRRDYDAIVLPSGSCTFMIRKNFFRLFEDDTGTLQLLEERVHMVYELIEFIYRFRLTDRLSPRFPHSVTYHPSCHYLRGLKMKEEPKKLLEIVEGLRFIPMEHEELCCGFGGLFSIKMDDVSAALANRKADLIEQTGAEYVTTPDLSCLLNLEGILMRRNSPVRAIHLAEILASGV